MTGSKRAGRSDLDAVRAVAALAVLVGHVRGLFFADYADATANGLFTRVAYFATGFGHEAVIVFFVLSGFLVGGSVFASIQRGRFGYGDYFAARVSRLATVLWPALVLGLVWDSIGLRVFGESSVYGGGRAFGTVVGAPVAQHLGLVTFVGNAFCLQEVLVPTLGSNGALWSLTNEWWYYVLCPLLVASWREPSIGRRVAAGVVAVAVAVLLGRAIVLYFAIWLLGAAAAAFAARRASHPGSRALDFAVTILVFACLIAARARSGPVGDFAIGGAVALWLYVRSRRPDWALSAWSSSVVTHFAEISYSLYLAHLPVVVFAAAVLTRGVRFQPSLAKAAVAAAVVAVVYVYSVVVWWTFERRTPAVRGVLGRLFGTRAPATR